MKFLLTLVALCILSSTVNAVAPNNSNTAEKIDSKDSLISGLYGRWEGNVDHQYFENTTLNKKYSNPFRIEITPTALEFFDKDETGEWKKISASFVNSFKFKIEKNTLSGYFFTSGSDEDGIWVESQTMYITVKDDNTILYYSMRSVNNTGIKDSKPGTKWMKMGIGELKKN